MIEKLFNWTNKQRMGEVSQIKETIPIKSPPLDRFVGEPY